MHDQSNETMKDQDRFTEQCILTRLLSRGQGVWSVEELMLDIDRELDMIDLIDALDRLKAAGLVHRCNDFVFATRAAVRFDGIQQDL
jgi:hypothetical protein